MARILRCDRCIDDCQAHYKITVTHHGSLSAPADATYAWEVGEACGTDILTVAQTIVDPQETT